MKRPAGRSVWGEVLSKAATASKFPNSHVLCLGRPTVGKVALVKAIQEVGARNGHLHEMEALAEGNGVGALSYAYINVRNLEDNDLTESLAKLNIWIIQDPRHVPILMKRFKPEYLRNFIALICVDLTQPWTLKDDVRRWSDLAVAITSELRSQLPADEQQALRERLSRYLLNYRGKVTDEKAEDFAKRALAVDQTPEEEEVKGLKTNLGIPLVFAVCKSDAASQFEGKARRGQGHVCFGHLRHLAVTYGATIIYCSTSGQKNLSLLYRYMNHRLYDFEFSLPPKLDAADSLFMPGGWDTPEEIQDYIATTIAGNFDAPFESIVMRPLSAAQYKSELSRNLAVEEMAAFLSKHAVALGAVPAVGRKDRREHTIFYRADKGEPQVPAASRRAATRVSERLQKEAAGEAPASEVASPDKDKAASLRSFFEKLLTKQPPPEKEVEEPPAKSRGGDDSPASFQLSKKKDRSSDGESVDKKPLKSALKSMRQPAPANEQAEKSISEKAAEMLKTHGSPLSPVVADAPATAAATSVPPGPVNGEPKDLSWCEDDAVSPAPVVAGSSFQSTTFVPEAKSKSEEPRESEQRRESEQPPESEPKPEPKRPVAGPASTSEDSSAGTARGSAKAPDKKPEGAMDVGSRRMSGHSALPESGATKVTTATGGKRSTARDEKTVRKTSPSALHEPKKSSTSREEPEAKKSVPPPTESDGKKASTSAEPEKSKSKFSSTRKSATAKGSGTSPTLDASSPKKSTPATSPSPRIDTDARRSPKSPTKKSSIAKKAT